MEIQREEFGQKQTPATQLKINILYENQNNSF